jgi:hypothetical protein
LKKDYNCDKVLKQNQKIIKKLMPEESINLYISNISSLILFIAVVVFIFLVLFLISKVIIFRSRKKNNEAFKFHRIEGEGKKPKKISGLLFLKKDIYIKKNIFIFGLVFIFSIFFVLLITLVLSFATQIQLGMSLFVIVGLLFLLLVISIYIIKSKIIN